MEHASILNLADSEKLVICSDSVPVVLGDTVEQCKEWVFQNDPLCDPNRWIQIPKRDSLRPEKWVNINKFGKVWTIYHVQEIV